MEDLEGFVREIPLVRRKIFLRGNLNGHVRRAYKGYKSVHEGYGGEEANAEGKTILYFT